MSNKGNAIKSRLHSGSANLERGEGTITGSGFAARWAQPEKVERHFVKGFLPDDFGILSAPTNDGKTTLLLSWAMSMMTGTPWAGQPVREAYVLYIDSETGRYSIFLEMKQHPFLKQKIDEYHTNRGKAVPFRYVDINEDASWDSSSTDTISRSLDKLILDAKEHSANEYNGLPVYVILDARDRLFSGARVMVDGDAGSKDIEEEKSWALRRIITKHKVAGLIAHHSPKLHDRKALEALTPSDAARGNSGVVSQFKLRMSIVRRRRDPNGVGLILKNEGKAQGVDESGNPAVLFTDLAMSFNPETFQYGIMGDIEDYPLSFGEGGKSQSKSDQLIQFLRDFGDWATPNEIAEGVNINKSHVSRTAMQANNKHPGIIEKEGTGKSTRYRTTPV